MLADDYWYQRDLARLENAVEHHYPNVGALMDKVSARSREIKQDPEFMKNVRETYGAAYDEAVHDAQYQKAYLSNSVHANALNIGGSYLDYKSAGGTLPVEHYRQRQLEYVETQSMGALQKSVGYKLDDMKKLLQLPDSIRGMSMDDILLGREGEDISKGYAEVIPDFAGDVWTLRRMDSDATFLQDRLAPEIAPSAPAAGMVYN